uniref:Uncharacterized protein n=1 Tax=Rhizophora mucronata TaxID=61149 RepID=A0A2P2L3W9_RHIMU
MNPLHSSRSFSWRILEISLLFLFFFLIPNFLVLFRGKLSILPRVCNLCPLFLKYFQLSLLFFFPLKFGVAFKRIASFISSFVTLSLLFLKGFE